MLEQKAEIERLTKKGEEDQQAIALLETRLKNSEGTSSALLKIPQRTHLHIYNELAFRLTEKFASLPSIDDLSAQLEVLKTERTSLQQSLKESHERETKTKKELEEKHAQAMAEMAEKLKTSQQRVMTLVAKAQSFETEAKKIDETIFRKNLTFSDICMVLLSSEVHFLTAELLHEPACLGYEFNDQSKCTRAEAYVEAKNSVEDLIEACRAIARKLSLKGYRTTVIDKMAKLMLLVPEIMEDWQESSARGAVATVLAMCKAHFPAMDFATIARGVPKGTNVKKALAETHGFDTLFAERVDHEAWYEKYDVPAEFAEEDDEVEGSGSSAHQSDSGSGDASGQDKSYQASEDQAESSE